MPFTLPDQLPDSYATRVNPGALMEEASDGTCTIKLISGQEVTLSPATPLDLEQHFDTQPNGNRMWMYSLYVLRVLGEVLQTPGNEHLRPTWEAGWHSAHAQLRTASGRSRAENIPSGDHAAATRLHACMEAAALSDDPRLRLCIHEIAEQALTWLMQESNYIPGNHGLMGSIALLTWHVVVERPAGGRTVRDTAVRRILDLAATAFASSGMCNENTVGYHLFNLRCYDQVVHLHRMEDIDSRFDDELLPILHAAERALALALLPDNTVPTLGDSGRVPVRSPQSVSGLGDFSDSGLGIVKTDDLYVSLICGARSEIHKHHDDTSVSVWWKNQPMIVDTGSYLYDRSDPYRLTMESSRGHSGIYPELIDGMLRSALVRTHPTYAASMTQGPMDCGNGTNMRGTMTVPGVVTVTREVTVFDPGWIVVRDRVENADISPERTRQRWLMGPGLMPRRIGHGWWTAASPVGTGGLSIISYGNFREDLYAEETVEPHRGWYSPASGVKDPIHGLDLIVEGAVQFITTIVHVGDELVTNSNQIPAEVLRCAGNPLSGE